MHRTERKRKPVTIVTYHSIGCSADPYTISPVAFERQIRLITARYEVRRLREIVALLRRDEWRRRVVVITFDDALADFFDTAFPILGELSVPSTVFVPSGFVGGFNRWEPADSVCGRKKVMDPDQLRALQKTDLVDFGSHTVDHVRMTELSRAEMERQAVESKATLEDLLGAAISSFAYPYGQLGDFSAESERALCRAGYSTAVTSYWGARNAFDERLRLRRIFLRETDSEAVVRHKIEGWYDWVTLKERIGFTLRRLGRPRSA